MTTSLTNRVAMPRGRSQGPRRVIRSGLGCGVLATLLLSCATPAALAQSLNPAPNRVYAGCTLSSSTVTALQGHIQTGGNPRIASATVTYVVVYSVNNDNNGQALLQGSTPAGFTGPVICVNTSATAGNVSRALQTDDIASIDILDVQDALILRHAPTGTTTPGRNRICHTTDGITDCFNIAGQ